MPSQSMISRSVSKHSRISARVFCPVSSSSWHWTAGLAPSPSLRASKISLKVYFSPGTMPASSRYCLTGCFFFRAMAGMKISD